MTFAILPFIVCLLVLLILWLIIEYIFKVWPLGWPHAPALVRLIFAILVILCILHGLGVVSAPVTVT
jgi:hypothetical protein